MRCREEINSIPARPSTTTSPEQKKSLSSNSVGSESELEKGYHQHYLFF